MVVVRTIDRMIAGPWGPDVADHAIGTFHKYSRYVAAISTTTTNDAAATAIRAFRPARAKAHAARAANPTVGSGRLLIILATVANSHSADPKAGG